MHISEGVLSAPVLITGALLSAGGVAAGLRKMDLRKIPEVAVVSSGFFVASLIRIPLGPASIHLTLNGLLGLLLGWMSFPSVLVAVALQAVLFQYGGLTTLGVNTFVMAFPALVSHYIFGPFLKRGRAGCAAAGLGAGAAGIAVGTALVAASLMGSGREFAGVAKLLAVASLPAACAEAVITAFIVLFLWKVKPEVLPGGVDRARR